MAELPLRALSSRTQSRSADRHPRARCLGRSAQSIILRLHEGGTGILKIGKSLGIGTGTVQRVLMEQPRPFDVDVAKAAFASL